MPIDHYVFDVGMVLIHWDPHLIYKDLIPDAAERSAFLSHICSPAWNLEQDRGRSWRQAESLLIKAHPDKAHLIRSFKTHWVNSIPHAYDDVVELMLALIDKGQDVTLLTNFNQETYPDAQARYEFLNKPRGVTVSGDVKLIKPDQAIYDHHTKTFDLNPERTLFIDDSPINVEGAKTFGWKAIQFTGAEGARSLQGKLAEQI